MAACTLARQRVMSVVRSERVTRVAKRLGRFLLEHNCLYNYVTAKRDQGGLNLGLVNYVRYGDQCGVTLSVSNIVHGSQTGIGMCVTHNDVLSSQKGVFFSIVNTANSLKGIALSVASVIHEKLTGFVAAGVFSAVDEVKGAVLSTINIIEEKLVGFAAGVIVDAQRLRGVMFGLVTMVHDSENSKGLQLGIVNVYGTTKGTKIRPLFVWHSGKEGQITEVVD